MRTVPLPHPRCRYDAPVLSEWLLRHSMPRYLAVGGISFAIDILALKVLHGIWDLNLIAATVIAYAAAFGINFNLSRLWTFSRARESPARGQAARYTLLVLCNLLATIVIVAGLVYLGMNYLIAKVISSVVIALTNFLIARRWVFI
jgi:putative flippase GtrA